MTDVQLSDEAFEALKLLAQAPGSMPPGPGWDELTARRFVMGSSARAHITQKGKAFVLKQNAE